jgi:hypothetical protein
VAGKTPFKADVARNRATSLLRGLLAAEQLEVNDRALDGQPLGDH